LQSKPSHALRLPPPIHNPLPLPIKKKKEKKEKEANIKRKARNKEKASRKTNMKA